MALQFERRSKKPTSINVIPMINVIFMLLIFFIITGHYQSEEVMDISAPFAESGKDIGEQEIKLVLTNDGMVILNDIPIPPNKIYKELSNLLQKHDNTPSNMIIMADAGLQAEDLLAALDDVQRAGVSEISLVTKGI